MLPVISVNGVFDAQISPLDRGFAYGDGLFETCRMLNGTIPLWRYHLERLQQSAKQLYIPVNLPLIEQYIKDLVDLISEENRASAIVKIIISRGVGGRGYKQPDEIQPTICVGIFPGNEYPMDYYRNGISAKLCVQQLSVNASIAGLKHLNRLEQVLARAEWQDNRFAEGILLNTQGFVIEGTMSNLFVVKQGEILTPDLQLSGVAGVMRRYIIDELALAVQLNVNIANLTFSDIQNAEELFVCNSVIGIWPITEVCGNESIHYAVGSATRLLQQQLNSKFHYF